MRTNQINIDGEKLAEILKERGLMATKVSAEIGYHPSAISRCVKAGHMAKNMAKSIELRYGIACDKFVIPEEKKQPEQASFDLVIDEKKTADPIDYEKLWKVIYTATYEAMKKAWNE